MVDLNKFLPLARLIVFGIVTVLSVANFAIACFVISRTTSYIYGYYYTYSALALATAILSLLTVPLMYWLSITRKGAFTSMIVTEVVWCWFLWIMWVATAGSTVWVNGFRGDIADASQALEAFAFLMWFALFAYTTTLFVVSIMSHVKGHSGVWTSTVNDWDFNTSISQSAIPPAAPQVAQPTMVQQPTFQQQPLAPQAAYTPQPIGYAGQPVQGTPQQPPVAMV